MQCALFIYNKVTDKRSFSFPEMQEIKVMSSALKNFDYKSETYGRMFIQSLGYFSAVSILQLVALTVT